MPDWTPPPAGPARTLPGKRGRHPLLGSIKTGGTRPLRAGPPRHPPGKREAQQLLGSLNTDASRPLRRARPATSPASGEDISCSDGADMPGLDTPPRGRGPPPPPPTGRTLAARIVKH